MNQKKEKILKVAIPILIVGLIVAVCLKLHQYYEENLSDFQIEVTYSNGETDTLAHRTAEQTPYIRSDGGACLKFHTEYALACDVRRFRILSKTKVK